MKTLVLSIFFFVQVSFCFSQPSMQATIKKGSDEYTVNIFAKSAASFSLKDDQITISLAIPAIYSPAPSMGTSGRTPNGTGPVTGITGIRPTILVNNIGTQEREVVVSTETINGVAHYIYVFLFSTTATADHNWVAGEEQLISSISFGGCMSPNCLSSIKLVSLPNGGSNQLAYWYYQVSPSGDRTNSTTPFYANPEALPPVNGALSLIELGTLISLPAKLLSFNSDGRNCNANLSWQTSEETDLSYYAVERSEDAISFQEVGRVNTSNNSGNVKSYSFKDESSPVGTIFYRLRLVDKEGKYGYSSNTKVFLNCRGKHNILVYPSPSQGLININLPPGFEQARIRIINTRGEEVSVNTAKSLTRSMSLKRLANGTYIIQVIQGNKKTENIKIVLNQ